ncbi:NAD(+) diphosphatase [Sphingomonas sp.]|uniref:NAD(+) diphosphatase n=1 Tax=Sphingomonas sp. TaxID=28214 RepID=UPI002DD69CE0|nr:NAD(+) diphosphatase [Sphingomonas sp.]
MIATGFTGGWLDRADHVRGDPDALARLTGDWRARLLKLQGGDPSVDAEGRLAWGTLADAADDGTLVFLGLDDGGRPHFAESRPGDASGPARSPALYRMLDAMPAGDAAIFGAVRSVTGWHARNRFCANCATPTQVTRGGWLRKCPSCAAEHYPRVDPVVIMLAEHDGRALLGRQAMWPKGRYSALAGFVEPGESLEEAVAREVHEEAGVRVRDVRYVASQPWPFPGQLMIAAVGIADDDTLTIDANEIEHAIWATRDEVRAALAGDPAAPFLPPPPYAIARTLLEWWTAQSPAA